MAPRAEFGTVEGIDSTNRTPHETQPDAPLADFLATTDLDPSDLDDSGTDVGARIAAARSAADMDLATFAAKIGVRRETAAAWEAGTRQLRSNKLMSIAGILGVSLSWLMIGRGEAPSPESRSAPLAPELAEIREIRADLADLVERIDRIVDSLPQSEVS